MSDDRTAADGTMTLIEKTVFLKSVEVLAGVPTEALAQLAGRASEVRCERGQVLFREGDEDHGTFIVVEGQLELRKAGTIVRKLKEGTAQGELFLGENENHQYTAVAVENSLLLNLRREDVHDALLEYPEFGLAMVKDLALRIHKLTQRMIDFEAEAKRRGAAPASTPDGAIEPAEPASTAPRQRGWWRRRRVEVPHR